MAGGAMCGLRHGVSARCSRPGGPGSPVRGLRPVQGHDPAEAQAVADAVALVGQSQHHDPGTHGRPGGQKVCDMGCAEGSFLLLARRRGAEVFGVELDQEAIAALAERKIPAAASLPGDRQFDVLTAFQVIEHLPDPAAWVRSAGAAVGLDGRLLLALPNGGEIDRVGPTWVGFRQDLEHLNYFSIATLSRLLADNGFYVEQYWETLQAWLHQHAAAGAAAADLPLHHGPNVQPSVLHRRPTGPDGAGTEGVAWASCPCLCRCCLVVIPKKKKENNRRRSKPRAGCPCYTSILTSSSTMMVDGRPVISRGELLRSVGEELLDEFRLPLAEQYVSAETFLPFGGVAEQQAGLAQEERFLLDAPAVGQHELRPGQQPGELDIGQRVA